MNRPSRKNKNRQTNMNLNELAKIITEQEGKAQSLSIAQVKEVLRIVLRMMKEMDIQELAALFRRVK